MLVDSLPRTGIPVHSPATTTIAPMSRRCCAPTASPTHAASWYDVVPHYRFPTLLIRICDMMPYYRDVLAVTAPIQATVAWMVDLRQHNMSFRLYDRTLIAENKWRAVRYGLDGNLVDFGIEQRLPARELIRELLERVEPVSRKLNSWHELEHCYTILERGSPPTSNWLCGMRRAKTQRPWSTIWLQKRRNWHDSQAIFDHRHRGRVSDYRPGSASCAPSSPSFSTASG